MTKPSFLSPFRKAGEMLETHGVGGGESSAGKETHPSPAPIFLLTLIRLPLLTGSAKRKGKPLLCRLYGIFSRWP